MGKQEIVATMLARGANVHVPGSRYGGVLQAAARTGNMQILEDLLKMGTNVNVQEGEFGTALQAAAFYGSVHMMATLLEHGATAGVHGGRYGCAMNAARKSEASSLLLKDEMLRLLKLYGAKDEPVDAPHEDDKWILTSGGWNWRPQGKLWDS